MPNYKSVEGVHFSPDELTDLVASYGFKIGWFYKCGYQPHFWQLLFHCMRGADFLTRFRHLVAGRRGGKTLSAAWEVLFYLLHPEEFHRDVHGVESKRALWVWQLSENYKLGFPALKAFREVLTQAGLVSGVDYREHKGDKSFEFTNGSRIDFKSADDPESLRGAGLDILWIDEAAFIRSRQAWDAVRPALSQSNGTLITTTTPDGKNWFYEEFWSPESLADDFQGRVEYTSIDNPYFPKASWEYEKKRQHPLMFRREFMASFDAMAGKELDGDWLKYYTALSSDDRKGLRVYLGVDPAISMSAGADRFVITAVGVSDNGSQTWILNQWAGKIPFPEQLDKIKEWHQTYKPFLIGVESTAYQAALAQQAARMPGLPPIVPMFAKGKKSERILAMTPLFKIGRVLIKKDMNDFISEWIDYDPEQKNPKDDCLDSAEIALRTAGVLLPEFYSESDLPYDENIDPITLEDVALRDRFKFFGDDEGYDTQMGASW